MNPIHDDKELVINKIYTLLRLIFTIGGEYVDVVVDVDVIVDEELAIRSQDCVTKSRRNPAAQSQT